MQNQPYGWTGTAAELLRAVFDVTGSTALTPSAIGQALPKLSHKLYYDGICHEEKRVKGARKHVFYKRDYRTPQYGFFTKDGEND
jgi:hypothetical protein